MVDRASWDATWRNIALVMSYRGDCERAQVGAVIVSADNQALALTYNGPPPGSMVKCATDCPRYLGQDFGPSYSKCLTVHAEAHGLLRTTRAQRLGGSIYVSSQCCMDCAKLLASSGLIRVCMDVNPRYEYRGLDDVTKFLERHGLEVVLWEA